MSYGQFIAALRFDDEANYELGQHAIVGALGRHFEEFSLRLSAGAIIDGNLEGERRSYDVLPGFTASVSAARQWFGKSDAVPFLTTTLAYGMSWTRIEERGGAHEKVGLAAADLRLGVLFGMNFADTWSPYAAARVFGGPVSFRQLGRDRVGSDRHHYAIGPGSSLLLGQRLQLSVDSSLIGEKSLSVGVSYDL